MIDSQTKKESSSKLMKALAEEIVGSDLSDRDGEGEVDVELKEKLDELNHIEISEIIIYHHQWIHVESHFNYSSKDLTSIQNNL